jgi:hypothetical protein
LSSHYFTVNVPYVYLPHEYRPKLDVSLPPEDDPKFLTCVLPENLPQFDFGEFPHHPQEMNTPLILNDPTSKNPLDLNQLGVEVRQLVPLYLSTNQETFDSGTCRQTRLKCAGVPLCMKCTSQRMISGMSTKKSGISFSKKTL